MTFYSRQLLLCILMVTFWHPKILTMVFECGERSDQCLCHFLIVDRSQWRQLDRNVCRSKEITLKQLIRKIILISQLIKFESKFKIFQLAREQVLQKPVKNRFLSRRN